MRFSCSLILPTDVRIVPVARHFSQNAMAEFGVDPECVAAVSLAITEACANVVEHSNESSGEFEVHIELNDERCIIRVVDQGIGLPESLLDGAADIQPPPRLNERGRGLFLMRTLVDNVRFESKPERGTIVHLEKELTFLDNAAVNLMKTEATTSNG